MSLAGIAKANNDIIARGSYITDSGATVVLAAEFAHTIDSAQLYTGEQLQQMLQQKPSGGGARDGSTKAAKIEVVAAKTGEAACDLARQTGQVPMALNFASAKNPGGGYLRGARAQEEDLSRCSALYNTQLKQRGYYETNRSCGTLLYTDLMIYSDRVPFFRDEHYRLLDKPVLVSVLTSPAPNAGEVLRRDPDAGPSILKTLQSRAGMLLALAEDRGCRHLVLGAWGCGVFRNDPASVANAFGDWLESERFLGSFDHIVFAIYERGKDRPQLNIFRGRF